MAYDLLVLSLSSIGLVRSLGRSDLWSLLFQDGIVYFIVAFSANTVATVSQLTLRSRIVLVSNTYHSLGASPVEPQPRDEHRGYRSGLRRFRHCGLPWLRSPVDLELQGCVSPNSR